MQFKDEHVQQVIDLIGKRISGELSPDEQAFVAGWIAEGDENRQLFDELSNAEYRSSELREMAGYTDVEIALTKFLSTRKRALTIRRNSLFIKIAAAAAAIAVIVFGVYFFTTYRHLDTARHPELVSGFQDIAPGKNGATITLGNGQVIELSNAKSGVIVGKDLRYNDGVAVQGRDPELRQDDDSLSRHPEFITGTQLTARTARGQTYQFTLPDGTKVWLNADSKITFPSQFSGRERKILLDGEAYFEVAKVHSSSRQRAATRDLENIPFIVVSKGQQVRVLGTHFNINSYADEVSVKTTLLEGSIEVSTTAPNVPPGIQPVPGMRFVLVPGQQANYNGQSIKLQNVDAEGAVSWKSGYFVFNETTLETIMRQVERWYNVDVEYEDPTAKSRMLGGSALRSGNLSVILNTLESTGAVKFKIEGRQVIVK